MSEERVASPVRLAVIGVCIAALATGSSLLAGRMALGPERDRLLEAAPARGEVIRRETAIRGTISDRNGTILAVTVTRYRLVKDRVLPAAAAAAAADALAPALGVARPALLEKLGRTDQVYLALSTILPESAEDTVRAAVRAAGVGGIRLEPVAVRYYPQGGGTPGTSLASTLLGFVNGEGVGQYGVEGSYDAQLTGSDLVYTELRSAAGGSVPGSRIVIEAGAPGENVILTIDAALQTRLETIATAAAERNGARTASIAVMDPDTGEILALATAGGYDANDYRQAAGDLAVFDNPFTSEVYAPGSVMKSATIVAALEAGIVTANTSILDTAEISLDGGDATVRNANFRGMGMIPVEDVLAYSRNVGTTRIALLLGTSTQERAEAIYQIWAKLGLTAASGSDMVGEAAGLTRDPSVQRWAEIDLSNASFGQGVSVTGLQLLAAYGAMVNGGILLRPRLALSFDGVSTPIVVRGTAMSGSTSSAMVRMLRHVIETNYRSALVPGYVVGGKTGTAQVYDASLGAFDQSRLDFSLIGYVEDATGRRLAVALNVRDATAFDRSTSAAAYRTAAIMGDTVRAIVETLNLPPIRDTAGKLWRQETDLRDERRAELVQ